MVKIRIFPKQTSNRFVLSNLWTKPRSTNAYIRITLYLLIAQLFGCNNPDIAQEAVKVKENVNYFSHYDKQLSARIEALGLTGNPIPATSISDINSPKAQLGKKLFYSKALSGDMDTACASCHHPILGGGDSLALPIGAGALYPDLLGIGRTLKNPNTFVQVPRNAPTTFNIAAYQKALFHDGRIELVDGVITTPDVRYPKIDVLAGDNLAQAQARFPVTSHAEMRGSFFGEHASNQLVRQSLAKRLGGYGEGKGELTSVENRYWIEAFRLAFGDSALAVEELITEQNISKAISEYERSQVFVNNPWSRYIQGDYKALSEKQKQGALLFFTPILEGGAGCFSCHSGDNFSNESFYNAAIPQVGIGKGNGITKTDDFGRMLVSKDETDKYRFRVPSLLNIEMTGPWGHSGAYNNLYDIVTHMLNPNYAIAQYHEGKISQQGIYTVDWKTNTQAAIAKGIDLPEQEITEEKVTALTDFLRSLTDPCTKDRECLKPWLEDENDDPMYLQLRGVNQSGERLSH